MSDVIAILASDIHLSHRAPIARSAEPSWYDAMKRPMVELKRLRSDHQCPVLIAGDVFDDGWRPHRCPPELVNFALENIPPESYGIPGQHDLPNHRYDEIKRSAYWTLAKSKKLKNLHPYEGLQIGTSRLIVYAFPWNHEVRSTSFDEHDFIRIALIHDYIWTGGTGYEGADEQKKAGRYFERLQGYDVAHFGDNHQTVHLRKCGLHPEIYNPGTFMCRKSDERQHRPQVGLLHANGSIEPHFLDTSKDKWLDLELSRVAEQEVHDVSKFVTELRSLGNGSLDYRDAVRRYMESKKVDKEVQNLVFESIE